MTSVSRISLSRMIVLAGVGMLLGACASAPNTFSQTDPTADFSQYKTYGFYDNPATNNAEYESLVTNFLKVSVAQQLDARGMNYDPQNPDIVVNFFLNTKEKVRSAWIHRQQQQQRGLEIQGKFSSFQACCCCCSLCVGW